MSKTIAKQIEKRLLALAKNKRANLSDGTVFTAAQFVRTFGKIFPALVGANPAVTQDATKFVRAYTEINRVLAAKGIKIKSKNYYSEFIIQSDKMSVAQAIKKMQKAAQNYGDAAKTLQSGFTRNKGIMTTGLTAKELSTAAARIGKPIF